MIQQLCDLRNALIRFRVQLRFGTLSRAPLQLLRLEWSNGHVECDWMARVHDEWDTDLPRTLSDANASLQALEDAILVRELLFYTVPDISSATLRVYRQFGDEPAELIIAGTVSKPEPSRWTVRSLAMQAKLCGFHFCLDNGKLNPIQVEQ
jgi:hypothetical protein